MPPLGSPTLAQPARLPTMPHTPAERARWRHPGATFEKENQAMWLIVLEAVGALALFVFLIWWTMFSGRRQGELDDQPTERGGQKKDEG